MKERGREEEAFERRELVSSIRLREVVYMSILFTENSLVDVTTPPPPQANSRFAANFLSLSCRVSLGNFA